MSSAEVPTVGTCQRCKRPQPLDDDRHVAGHAWFPPLATPVCEGSGKLSLEASAANAAAARKRDLARIESLRGEAQVAHDAVCERFPYPAFRLHALLKAALVDYRIRFPAPARVRPVQQPWFRQPQRARRRRLGADRCDIYCTFCRELLAQRLPRQFDPTNRVYAHTTICALRCLAKITEPVAPGEFRQPAELRPDGSRAP